MSNIIINTLVSQALKPILFRGSEAIVDDPDLYSKFLGTPVYGSLTFPEFTYTDIDLNTITLPEFTLEHIIIDIAQSRNVVSTALQGRAGTIKEFISDGDYQISMSGVITSTTQEYPSVDVTLLNDICSAKIALPVINDLLNLFGIDKIVITSKAFKQQRGSRAVQFFDLTALSDTDINLEVNAGITG